MRCPTCKLDTLRPIIDGPTGRETGHSVCMHCAGRPQPGVVHLTPTANRFAVAVPPDALLAQVQEETLARSDEAPWSPFELSPSVPVTQHLTVTEEQLAAAEIRTVEQVDALRAALGVPGLRDVATPEEIAQAEAHYADDLQARFDAIPEDAEPQAVTPEMVTKGIDAMRGKKR